MKKTLSILIFVGLILSFTNQGGFLTSQKKYPRVRTAIKEKQTWLNKKLQGNKLSMSNINILLVAYKELDTLEVYAKSKWQKTYKKILSYKICARSGVLGPKRKAGDYQVPEGFYYINRFNPASKFYLSLGLNYPNLSDKRKSKYKRLGGDIFIHGNCVTIGCLPITDDFIKELYVLAINAKNNGQHKIPVYIFPFKMTEMNISSYKAQYKNNKELHAFWDNIKQGYDKFTENPQELTIQVAKNGDYVFAP